MVALITEIAHEDVGAAARTVLPILRVSMRDGADGARQAYVGTDHLISKFNLPSWSDYILIGITIWIVLMRKRIGEFLVILGKMLRRFEAG